LATRQRTRPLSIPSAPSTMSSASLAAGGPPQGRRDSLSCSSCSAWRPRWGSLGTNSRCSAARAWQAGSILANLHLQPPLLTGQPPTTSAVCMFRQLPQSAAGPAQQPIPCTLQHVCLHTLWQASAATARRAMPAAQQLGGCHPAACMVASSVAGPCIPQQ
jgi:hypothetical protein